MPEAVRHLPAGINRSPLQDHGVPLDVAPHHRTVPDECVFSFQSALKEQIRSSGPGPGEVKFVPSPLLLLNFLEFWAQKFLNF